MRVRGPYYYQEMKVIMLKDLKGVGQRDAVKDVSDGYGLNFLIAQGYAIQATPAKLAETEARMNTESTAHAARERQLAALAQELKETVLTVSAKANASGHLYTQLSQKMILDAIKTTLHVDIPQSAVMLSSPIKEVGETEVALKFGSHNVLFKVNIVGTK